MENIGQILSEASAYNNQKTIAAGLAEKWAKTGLLDGIADERTVNSMAVMLENQAGQLVRESSQTGTNQGSEEWAGVALPLVRRIFSEIVAKDLVSVQPMNLPSGLVFYLDFKYGTAQPGFTTGSDRTSSAGFQQDSVYGVTETASDPDGGLYGSGRFGYSINDTSSVELSSGSSLAADVFVTGAVAASTYNFDTRWSASYAGQFDAEAGIHTLTVSASNLPSGDPEGVRAFVPTAANIGTHFPDFTTISANKQQITFVVSGSGAVDAVTIKYHKQPGEHLTGTSRLVTDRGDFEYTGENLDIPELNVEMRSEVIAAKTRKLKAIWTPEFAQDLNAYHSIDAEQEVTSLMSEYVSQEIDFEILDMLTQGALSTEHWSAKTGKIWNGVDGFTNASAADAAQAFNQGEWFQTLGTKIQKVSNQIHKKTMRGGANFIVVSPDVATILESIPGYAANTNGDSMQFAMGVQKVGMLNNRFTVYKNPYYATNKILLGFRGTQFLETGAVYAPYIPLMMTPLVMDPDNFVPRKAIMTRYAKKMVRPEFYGIINVSDLDAV